MEIAFLILVVAEMVFCAFVVAIVLRRVPQMARAKRYLEAMELDLEATAAQMGRDRARAIARGEADTMQREEEREEAGYPEQFYRLPGDLDADTRERVAEMSQELGIPPAMALDRLRSEIDQEPMGAHI